MGSKVLTTIPAVLRRKGRRGLICAGHSIAPEHLPAGAVTVECHRCGRLVLLTRSPVPPEDPSTRFVEELSPPPPPAEAMDEQEQTNAVVALVSQVSDEDDEEEITLALEGPELTPEAIEDEPEEPTVRVAPGRSTPR